MQLKIVSSSLQHSSKEREKIVESFVTWIGNSVGGRIGVSAGFSPTESLRLDSTFVKEKARPVCSSLARCFQFLPGTGPVDLSSPSRPCRRRVHRASELSSPSRGSQ